MSRILALLLLAGAAALSGGPAAAAASASITVNGTTRTLSKTGFLFERIGIIAVNLAPGQSADYPFDYSLSVQDDGLAAPFDPLASGCTFLFPTTCGPAYSGFEFAKAYLLTFGEDPRVTHRPGVVLSGVNSTGVLETHGDAFAESLSQSGTFQGHAAVDMFSGFSDVLGTFVALWVLTPPVPEPAVVAQMLGGLGLLGIAVRGRRRRGVPDPAAAPGTPKP